MNDAHAAPAEIADDRHILVVDDDVRLRDLLRRFLSENGYHVSVAGDAEEARAALRNFAFDLMVLDVMMPGQDGISFTGELRETIDLPILLLTARGETEDRISGLSAGADDYLVKPFDPRELLLRIATILRRARSPGADEEPVRRAVHFGDFTFDLERQELMRNGRPVHLTTAELSLLSILARQAGIPVDRRDLSEQSRISGSDRAVDTQIARLRRKVEADPRRPNHILTMRGAGYVLRTG